jgi:hypothetical protein
MNVFVAAPFTQALDAATGRVQAEYRRWLENVIEALEGAGYAIVSAHVREAWGDRLDSPAAALKTDLEDLRNAAVVVAHVGSPPSPGVQFELGAAVTLGIPIVLVLGRDEAWPYLNPALPTVARTEIVEIDRDEESSRRIVEAVSRVLSTGGRLASES